MQSGCVRENEKDTQNDGEQIKSEKDTNSERERNL